MTYKRILLATDFSEMSRHALEMAANLGRQLKAEVHALHVRTPDDDQPTAEQELEAAIPPAYTDVITERQTCRATRPELGIIRTAREGEFDLIVLGTHGRTGLKHVVMGSVAARVVQLAGCPVLTVRQPGHDFEHPSETSHA